MASAERLAVTPGIASPGISVEFHGDPHEKPTLVHPRSAPPDVQSFPSPMRHHRRTPSAHREIKETVIARSEYTNDESEDCTHRRINQYLIKDEIGRGSYGAVYLATDQFGHEYAVKAFSKTRLRKHAQSEILRHRGPKPFGRFPPRARFGAPDTPNPSLSEYRAKEAQDALFLIRKEVAIMKKLNHPNLVQLIEVLDDPEEDSLYMVLEMCKKGVVIKVGIGESATPYPEETCRHWFRDMILGIEYLHSQGVVHRDIKPENLLLTEDDVLKISDFGVSQMFEKRGDMRTAKSAGSPAFLPPELCVAKHGDVSGTAADLWSMGVSLYCLRYGRLPFECEGVLEMYEAIKTETPKLPPDENPEFVDLMSKLLEKDPEKRITMEDLREHPWVTRSGTDTLLSAEENCSDPVDPPNPLELNHAFTRRMSHLICVMKAIKKFKSLLKPKELQGQQLSSTGSAAMHSSLGPNQSLAPPDQQDGQSTAEFAARVLREREEFLKNGGKAKLNQLLPTSSPHPPHARHPSTASSSSSFTHDALRPPTPLPVLGIGTGGIDDFGPSLGNNNDVDDDGGGPSPAANVVSDSPTMVDFNIYDRAFEAEMERIKRSGSRKGGRGGAGGSAERRRGAPGMVGAGGTGTGREQSFVGVGGSDQQQRPDERRSQHYYTVRDGEEGEGPDRRLVWNGEVNSSGSTPRSLSLAAVKDGGGGGGGGGGGDDDDDGGAENGEQAGQAAPEGQRKGTIRFADLVTQAMEDTRGRGCE
ncbi:hypothetical protein VTK26DRAFT_5705 [Humicola hyalothermophila]